MCPLQPRQRRITRDSSEGGSRPVRAHSQRIDPRQLTSDSEPGHTGFIDREIRRAIEVGFVFSPQIVRPTLGVKASKANGSCWLRFFNGPRSGPRLASKRKDSHPVEVGFVFSNLRNAVHSWVRSAKCRRTRLACVATSEKHRTSGFEAQKIPIRQSANLSSTLEASFVVRPNGKILNFSFSPAFRHHLLT